MNNMYITELNDIQIMRAENSIISLESTRALGEYLGTARAYSENDSTISRDSILGKILNFIKKLVKFILKVSLNILKFVLKILKAPFKLIAKVMSKTGDAGASGNADISNAISSMINALHNESAVAVDESAMSTWNSMSKTDQSMLLTHVEKYIDGISLFDDNDFVICCKNNNVNVDNVNKIISAFDTIVSARGEKINNSFVKITEFLVNSNAGAKLTILKALTSRLPNPSAINSDIMDSAYDSILSVLYCLEVVLNLGTCDLDAFDTLVDKELMYNKLSVADVAVTTNIMNTAQVMKGIDNAVLLRTYPKMLISENEELYKYVYGTKKISEVERTDPTQLELGPIVEQFQKKSKTDGESNTWTYYVSSDNIPNARDKAVYDIGVQKCRKNMASLRVYVDTLQSYSDSYATLDFNKIRTTYFRASIDPDKAHAPNTQDVLMSIPKALSHHLTQINKLSTILDNHCMLYSYAAKVGEYIPAEIIKLTVMYAIHDYVSEAYTKLSKDAKEKCTENFKKATKKLQELTKQLPHNVVENN